MSHHSHIPNEQRLTFQLDRIALFSDAVFAIAITLLALELKLPPLGISGTVTRQAYNHAFNNSLFEMIPELAGLIISFFVIGSYWRAHHAMFGYVIDYDRKLLNINNLFLFTIVIMPFTTQLMSKYGAFNAYLFYCLDVMLAGILQWCMWQRIVKPANKLSDGIPANVVKYKSTTPLIVVICFLLSLPIEIFFGPIYSRIFLSSIFIINIFFDRYFKKKYQLGKRFV